MTEQLKPMTAHRAIYFMERFRKEEKLLGPNEQAAVAYVIAMLEAQDAQPAQAVPVLTEQEIVKCLTASGCVGTVKMSYDSGPYEITRTSINADRFARAIEQAVRAKMGVAVPMTEQISEGEFAPDAKLMELADKIDHEQNWRHSGIFQRDHLTQDQKDRVLAGVMLRRYADLMAPESWRLFPPKSVVSHSYRASTLEAVVKMAERHGIVGKEGA